MQRNTLSSASSRPSKKPWSTCGTPWPAAFGDTVTADFSFGADADAHLLWCAFHDNGAGAYIDACSTAFGRSTASVLQYAASAAASRCCIYWRSARAVHHNPLPALAQCHATVPKLLEARRRLWMGNNLVCASLSTRGVGTSIPDSAGGLRAVGLSFIGLSGLVSGMLPLTRPSATSAAAAARLHAAIQELAALPPSPKPWPLSDLSFFSSDSPFALSVCPLCRPREAARETAVAARTAARTAGVAEMIAAACAWAAPPD